MTTLIVFITAVFTALCVIIGLPLFILIMVRNSLQAAKYRRMIKDEIVIKKTGYNIVYKIGRKTEMIDVGGENESEAMAALIKKGMRYDKIVSMTKN